LKAPSLKGQLTFIALMSIAVFFASEKLHWVRSESVNPTFFWKLDRPMRQGDYMLIDLQDDLIGKESVAITKRVGCTAGQYLENKRFEANLKRIFYCDQHVLAIAKTKTADGTPLKHFNFNGVVPANQVFLVGEHKDSYDSRYWGFYDLNKPYITLKALF
jgi:conjugal transfer pilin signal peptidase TrbI